MLPREVWTSVSFPIWVSEPSLLHSSSETQTASSSNIEHVCCSQKEQGSHVKLNSSKGNWSNVRVALAVKLGIDMRIPWACISVPVDLISIWALEVESRLSID